MVGSHCHKIRAMRTCRLMLMAVPRRQVAAAECRLSKQRGVAGCEGGGGALGGGADVGMVHRLTMLASHNLMLLLLL